MPSGVGGKEVFAELFSKSDRISPSKHSVNFLVLHTNRKNEVEEIFVLIFLAGLNDHARKRSIHFAVNLFGITGAKSVKEITAIKSDIDTALNTLDLKLIGNSSVCGNGGDEKLFGSKAELNVALGLTESFVLGNEERSFKTANKRLGIKLGNDLAGGRNKLVIVKILSIYKTREEQNSACLENSVSSGNGDLNIVLLFLKHLKKLNESLTGQNEADLRLGVRNGRYVADLLSYCQTVTVTRDDLESVFAENEVSAVKSGSVLVLSNSKRSLYYHRTKNALIYCEFHIASEFGKRREIGAVYRAQLKFGMTGFDGDDIVCVDGDLHLALGHGSYDLIEASAVYNVASGNNDLRGNLNSESFFKVE